MVKHSVYTIWYYTKRYNANLLVMWNKRTGCPVSREWAGQSPKRSPGIWWKLLECLIFNDDFVVREFCRLRNDRPSFYGKLLWQPEYRLSIGIESGYYSMYSTTRIQTNNGSVKLTSRLKVVPIFLSISMNVINHLDINFGTGWVDMVYTVNPALSKAERVIGRAYSMSNYSAGFTEKRTTAMYRCYWILLIKSSVWKSSNSQF